MTFTENNINQTWITRNNRVCLITRVFGKGTFKFPVYGVIDGKEDMWTINGRDIEDQEGDLDLIRRVTKEENPECFI